MKILKHLLLKLICEKTKFLLFGGYRPPSQSKNYFFDAISNALDVYIGTYDKLLLAGDFNVTETDVVLNEFLYENNFKCLTKNNTCFKNPENLRCIDLFLTNFSGSFQNQTPRLYDTDVIKNLIIIHFEMSLKRGSLSPGNMGILKNHIWRF